MKIHKSYKFRLKPDKEQKQLLLQRTGSSRFVWNKLVEFNQQYRKENNNKFPSQVILQKEIVKLKNKEGNKFIKLTHSQPLQINAKRINEVNFKAIKPEVIQARKQKIAKVISEENKKTKKYKNYNHKKTLANAFNHGFPHFKKKSDMNGSLFYPQNFKIKRSRIFFAKLGWINFVKHRKVEGKIKSITIIQDGEQWNISICSELELQIPKTPISINDINIDNVIGIDVGIKEFATFSDGTVIHNLKISNKYADRLKKEQRKLSKKQFVEKVINGKKTKVSSSNRNKQKEKVRKIYRKMKNIRKDFLHKLSYRIITKYDGVIIETLDIKNMLQKNDKNMNRNTCDVSWYEFGIMLEYKSLWKYKLFHKIDKYFASSQICSECGNTQEMLLSQRTYVCNCCGAIIDRDLNGSINIRNEGISNLKQMEIKNKNTPATGGIYACEQSILVDWMKQEIDNTIQVIQKIA